MDTLTCRTLVFRQQKQNVLERSAILVAVVGHPLKRLINCPYLVRSRLRSEVMAVDKFEARAITIKREGPVYDLVIPALFYQIARQRLETDMDDTGNICR